MLALTVGRSDAAEMAKQHGCIATFGKGAIVPMGWKDAGCVNPDLAGVTMVCFPPTNRIYGDGDDADWKEQPDTTREPGPADHDFSYLQYNVRALCCLLFYPQTCVLRMNRNISPTTSLRSNFDICSGWR